MYNYIYIYIYNYIYIYISLNGSTDRKRDRKQTCLVSYVLQWFLSGNSVIRLHGVVIVKGQFQCKGDWWKWPKHTKAGIEQNQSNISSEYVVCVFFFGLFCQAAFGRPLIQWDLRIGAALRSTWTEPWQELVNSEPSNVRRFCCFVF